MTRPQDVDYSWDELLSAARDGLDWAWRSLLDRHGGSLLGYIRMQGVGDPEATLAETWIGVARGLGSFDGEEESFRSWLFVIAHRRVIDERRAASRRPVRIHEEIHDTHLARQVPAAEEEALSGALSLGEADRLLALLTDDQREVVALRFVADLSLEQTAHVVGRPVGAVKALQRRGLTRLRKHLTEVDPSVTPMEESYGSGIPEHPPSDY